MGCLRVVSLVQGSLLRISGICAVEKAVICSLGR